MKSDLRLVDIKGTGDVLVIYEDKNVAIISKDAIRKLLDEDIEAVESYRKF